MPGTFILIPHCFVFTHAAGPAKWMGHAFSYSFHRSRERYPNDAILLDVRLVRQ